jgi:cysteine desulfurase/selenocysteine lyase
MYNVDRYREDFPALHQKVHGKPLVYLDNAATSQKPLSVIESITRYYSFDNSNVHRGVHELSQRATRDYENARVKIQKFINAARAEEIIFVRGTTEGINLVTQTLGRSTVKEGDEIVISAMEHHSNIVPWQLLCEEKKAKLRVIPLFDNGDLDLSAYAAMLNSRTKLVAIVHLSNALGTLNPVKEMIELAHRQNIPVLVDGAQSIAHLPIDVQDLDCDFFTFSAHKIYGPTGIGVLYGKSKVLEQMPPYQGGGDMISSVTFEKTTFNSLPYKFEAGTPDIAGAIGLGFALDYVNAIGMDAIAAHEADLLEYATSRLEKVEGLRVIGTGKDKGSVISFVFDEIHPHDVGTLVDQEGIAIRTGHHCAQPVMDRFGVPATSRASFALYNTRREVDALIDALQKVKEVFA